MSGASFFLVNNEPGAGPHLHRHPYSETWIVLSGKARITADGEDIQAGSGDIVVVSPETPHKFKNIGADRLDIICIHASPLSLISQYIQRFCLRRAPRRE